MEFALKEEKALAAIGSFLAENNYSFTAITPATHAIVNARAMARTPRTLRDIFGWSRPFAPDELPPLLLAWLEEAGEMEKTLGLVRSKVRFSTLAGSLYVHSAFPTMEADSVFFGPDTYRFANLIERSIIARPAGQVRRILDLGCGSGAGGLFLAGKLQSQGLQVFLSDINQKALRYARVNAALAGRENVFVVRGDLTQALKEQVDIIVSNPPYLVDAESRLYRDGGGISGCDLSIRIVRESIPLLAPDGMLILYTGTPVVEGRHVFRDAVSPMLDVAGIGYEYTEIDPDVFGEELFHAVYGNTDRIAAVSLVVHG